MLDDIRALTAKKYEILGELELAKAAILNEMSSVDKCTLTKLREALDHYDRLEKQVVDKINTLEIKTNSFISSSEKDYIQYAEQIKSLEQLKASVSEIIKNTIPGVDAKVTTLAKAVDALEVAAMDALSGKNIVLIGDSNMSLYQATGYLENSANNLAIQKLSVAGATFRAGNNSILSQVSRIEGEPDYIIIWGGGNDIASLAPGNLGFPRYTDFTTSELNTEKTFDAVNYLLHTLRNNYPSAKLLGVTRSYRDGFDRKHYNYVMGVIGELYQKWSVPCIALDDIGNYTPEIAKSKQYYLASDGVHYNNNAYAIINEMIVGAINTGLNCSAHVEYDTHIYDADTDITTPTGIETAVKALANWRNYTDYAMHNMSIYNLYNAQYANISVSFYNDEVRIIRFRMKDKYLEYTSGDFRGFAFMQHDMISVLPSGDLAALDSGAYAFYANELANYTGFPDDFTATRGTLLVFNFDVKYSNFANYVLLDYSGNVWFGYLNSGKVVWSAKK